MHGNCHELRWTRNRAGAALCALALPILLAAVFVAATGPPWAPGGAVSPEGWTRLLVAGALLLAGVACFLFGLVLMRRTYVVATPLGLDILPLLRPANRMILLGWSELEGVEQHGRALVLRRRGAPPVRISGLRTRQAELLKLTVEGRLRQLAATAGATPAEPEPNPCP